MGLCESKVANEEDTIKSQERANREIEKEIGKERSLLNPGRYLEQGVLILGPGESGKSTLMKQIKLMGSPYTPQELIEKRVAIVQNLYIFSRSLLKYAQESALEVISKEDTLAFERMLENLMAIVSLGNHLDDSIAGELKYFWADKAIQEAFENRNKFHLPESAGYFFENLERIKHPDYEPTNQDVVYIRTPTVGVVSSEVVLKNIKLTVFDCGGQRQERNKWIKLFDDMQAVLFVAAISEYDQVIVEDGVTNRIEEALALFQNIFKGRFFKKSSIILFLNKIDIFEEKVQKIPISKHFPKFTGENTFERGVKYFRREFKSRLTSDRHGSLYTHETCAVSDQVQMIINTVIDKVVQENLKDTGMI